MSQAQYVVCLREGRVLHSGAIAEVYANPPTVEVMECLGPGNWLTPQEAELWLDTTIRESRCFRPEQIAVEPAHISHIVVRESTFLGSIAEVEVRDVNAAAAYRFVHRPSGPHLQPGSPVSIRLRTE